MNNRVYTVATDEQNVAVYIEDALTTVAIYDYITGLGARAHALWFREDTYDENIGVQVAYSRAVARLARKQEKYWIKQTQAKSY